jgi:hypothetical protein
VGPNELDEREPKGLVTPLADILERLSRRER